MWDEITYLYRVATMRWKNIENKDEHVLRLAVTEDQQGIVVMGLRSGIISFARHYSPSQKERIKTDLKVQGFEKCYTTLVITANYQVLLIDVQNEKNVNDDASLRDYMRDFIDPELEEAVWDYIEVPSKKKATTTRNYYIIAAKKQYLQTKIDSLKSLGFHINDVQVTETALCDLVRTLEDSREGLIFVYLSQEKASILLIENGVLHMMRDIKTGILSDEERSKELAEDVQKTLDYCNSNLGEFNEARIVLASLPTVPQRLLSHMSDLLTLPGRMVQLEEISALGAAVQLDASIELITLGALLKRHPV
ncbi:MAG: hypothetical protein U1E78_07400 [Gammaproteobacteria bacterium]